MNTAPSPGKSRTSIHAAAAKGTAAPLRSASERVRDRRRSLIVSLGILLVICAGVSAALVVGLPTPTPTPAPRPDLDFRTAKVMNDSGDGCRETVLDNQTWRMSGSKQPCDPVMRDANGVPIPVGTIHRLDAIGKSFSGK
jgi:hypothetical protein